MWSYQETVDTIYRAAVDNGEMIYEEHNDEYLRECLENLKEKNAPIDWEKVKQDGFIEI